MMQVSGFKKTIVLAASLVAIYLVSLPVKAEVMLAPTRLVFEGKKRSASVLLVNSGKTTTTYHINFLMKKMDETGKSYDIPMDEKDPHNVKNMIVFSPKRVTLPPDGRQSVRLSLRKPADLPPGEYRAYLVGESMPNNRRRPEEQVKKLSINFEFSFSTAIPVIVRNGDNGIAQDVTLENIQILAPHAHDKTQRRRVVFDIKHLPGAYSKYGRIEIYQDGNGGQDDLIGVRNNVAVYPEIERRKMDITLKRDPVSGKPLRIVYIGLEEFGGKTFAEATINVTN